MRIAVVGAGVSGLVAAHLLHREHEVTVFEANDYAGGHTNTVQVQTEHGSLAVDTGFIVFNDRNYPNLIRLFEHLGVASQPSTMTFSVADSRGDFEYSSGSANGLYAKRAHLFSARFQRMVYELVRFNREARSLLTGSGPGPSLGQWLEQHRFSAEFIHRLIVPQASAVWSADPRQMWSFPARFLVEFFDNHGMLSLRNRPRWRTVTGGSARYVEALTAPYRSRIRLSTPVLGIRRHADHVELRPAECDLERFDEVVIAAHSDQALSMLEDPSDREHELLSAIPYQPNEAVLHSDVGLLPRRRRAWASWNYHLLDEPAAQSTVTYHMNRLQNLSADRQYCVTLNHTAAIDPDQVIRRIRYAHPVFTPAGEAAQRRHGEISGRNRTTYCGAYWGWGFHEDGVVSALRACAHLGARLP